MRDSHSLMLTARVHREAASLCLSLVLFSIAPSNIWTLRSRGRRRTADSEPDSSSSPGVWTLCPVERDGCAGWDRPEGVAHWVGGGNDGLAKGGTEGTGEKGAHQYPVMAAWKSYCYRIAEITQDGQVCFLQLVLENNWGKVYLTSISRPWWKAAE